MSLRIRASPHPSDTVPDIADCSGGLSDAWRASIDITLGGSFASFGILLLLISWIIAAARFR